MQQRIIIFIVTLFILSSTWLFFVSSRTLEVDLEKNLWTVSFSDPKSEGLDFEVKNHSDRTDFHWEILNGKKKLKEGDFKIEKGQSEKIAVDDIGENGKIFVRVSSGEEKKEIYKNFDK